MNARQALLHRRPSEIFLGGFERDEIGPNCFVRPASWSRRLVSKRSDRPYLALRSGRDFAKGIAIELFRRRSCAVLPS